MRILVVNCNTSTATTEVIRDCAVDAARTGTEIVAVQPTWGVESAEGYLDSFVSAAAVLDLLTAVDDVDAVVMAGYGEHGREGARQLLEVPVVDITEASAQLACLVGHRYGVVTTLTSTIGGIRDNLVTAGLADRCAGIVAVDIPVLELHHDLERTAGRIAAAVPELRAAGADVVVLGCAGLAGLDRRLEEILGLPVIGAVSAAVALAESLVTLGKRTSKVGPYAPIRNGKERPGWPVSLAAAALRT